MITREYENSESTEYNDFRIHRHEDGTVEVQLEGKTSSCGGGNVSCAFLRSLAWVEDNEIHDPKECLSVDVDSLRKLVDEWREDVEENEAYYHQSNVPMLLDELEELIE